MSPSPKPQTPLLLISPFMAPYRHADSAIRHVNLLSLPHTFSEECYLAEAAQGIQLSPELRNLHSDLRRRADGTYRLEFAIELPDVLPMPRDRGEGVFRIGLRSGAAVSIAMSNQMARVRHRERDFSARQVLVRRMSIGQMFREGDFGTCSPEILHTVAAIQRDVPAGSVEDAIWGNVPEMIDQLIEGVQQISMLSLIHAPQQSRASHPQYSRGSFEYGFLLIGGLGPSRGHLYWLNPHKGSFGDQELSSDQEAKLRESLTVTSPIAATAYLLRTSRACLNAGLNDLAFLQAFFAAEAVVGKTVQRECLRRGISRNAYKSVERDLTISIHLKLLLRGLFGERAPSESVLGTLDEARAVRNQFAHEGVFDASRELVVRTVAAAEAIAAWAEEQDVRALQGEATKGVDSQES